MGFSSFIPNPPFSFYFITFFFVYQIGYGGREKSNDNSLDLQVRIAEIDAEFRKMLDRVSTETVEAFDEETATRLMNEKSRLQQQLDNIADAEQRRENTKSRLDDIYTILDGIKNHPMEYDDQIVRQLLECIVVDSKEQVTVIFKGGLKSVQPLTEWQRLTSALNLESSRFFVRVQIPT